MKKYRIGIVGAGLIARDHALSLNRMPSVERLNFFDQDNSRARQLAERFDGKVAGSLPELVAESDIVWICTPPFGRREAIVEACRARRAIFCEKPFALNNKDAIFFAATVRKAGVPFFMGQSGRYSSFFVKIKELVTQGVVGEPTQVWSTRLGWIDKNVQPAWRFDDELSGGTVIELGVHEIDFIRWVGGDWQSVYARGSAATLVPGGNYQDTVAAVGTLENNVIARLTLSWASPRYLWQRGVEGTEGSLFFDDSRVREVVLHRPGKKPEIFKTGDWQNKRTGENLSLRDQAHAVLQALASNERPPVTMEDGAAAARAAMAIRESVRTGRVMTI